MNASSRSNDFSLSSPIVLDKEKGTSDKATPIVGIRRAWLKRGVNAKPADWLNIFGATIGDTLGKSRKPPPRFV